MRTLYLDCGMGAAGDMLTAALLELLPNQDEFIEEMNALGIPNVHIAKTRIAKCGINGTQMTVLVGGVEEETNTPDEHSHENDSEHEHCHEHEHEHHHDHDHEHCHDNDHVHTHDHEHVHTHHHSSMHNIESIIANLNLPAKVKEDVLAVYTLIAEAESHAHGVPVTDIHFHEVGTMDAITDITAVCLLMDKLAPTKVIVSPIHVGSGHVRCAHGILPVPAPATAFILKDVPIYGGGIQGELCTPTGAALLKHFATTFGDMPVMTTEAIGYGMGKKKFETVNCLRALLGETADQTEHVVELKCNVDDMTAEELGYAMERIFEAGAMDVFTVPIGMKKSRPGTFLRTLCREQDKEMIVKTIFKYTTTIGIGEAELKRYVMDRSITTIQTPYGEVRRKDSSGYGVSRYKYEYEDLARIAKEQGISIAEVKHMVENQNF